MWNRILLLTTMLCATVSWRQASGQVQPLNAGPDGGLHMGLSGVGWEGNNNSGPLLYRSVNEAELVSVRAKITSQAVGNWSQAGVMVRVPNDVNAPNGTENWRSSWSFRAPAAGPFTHQSNMVTAGVEAEVNTGMMTADNLMYVRLDNMGGGSFLSYRGSGTDDNIMWTAHEMGPQANANLVGVPLQAGLAGGALINLAGAEAVFDWVEIQTTAGTFRDDFNYTHDFGLGLPATTIWSGTENVAQRCISCSWNLAGSGDFTVPGNWGGLIGFTPNANFSTVTFGSALTADAATVYNNTNVTLKQINFDDAQMYVLGGPGTITLDADTGNAGISVLQGSHEIQIDLILNDNVTATAAANSTLNINAPVFLNGHSWTNSGAGTINCNNSPSCLIGNGSSSLVNDANLIGLSSFAGDFTQTGNGSLAVEVGSAAINVTGSAQLAGVLDVSLADDFVPALGASYTVLTAESVTDLGLTLSGSAATAFHLAVGSGSVSLVAGAIPEPSTLILTALCAAAFASMPRRRCRPVSHSRLTLVCATVFVIAATGPRVRADVLTFGTAGDLNAPVTYRDEFNMFFDYAAGGGAVPTGTLLTSTTGATTKSWTAIHNPTGGGTPTFPPVLEAHGADFNGNPKLDVLFIEDLALRPNTGGGPLGMGWEGNKTSGPLLHANVRSEDSFDAVIKINAQTAGNWSYTPIIARRAGPGVGRTVGDGLEPTERFVTMGSFRGAPDNPMTPANEALNANLLTQNILEVDNTDATPEEQETQAGGAATGIPLWVRMSKNGAQFASATSIDGLTWTERNTVFSPDLNITGQMLEVGPSFTLHPGSPVAPGNTEIDYFEITVRKTQRPLDATWNPGNANASGNWNTIANWDSNSLPQVPDANSTDVMFSTANQTSGPATIFTNRATPNIVRSLTFDSPNKYAIAGAGGIAFEPDPQSLLDNDQTSINVLNGSHEIEVDLAYTAAAGNDNKIIVAEGAQLDINNSFNLNNKQLRLEGPGRVNFNNNIDTGTSGTVLIAGGNVGGTGRINGAVQNGNSTTPGGTIAPGESTGTLTIEGNFTPHSSGRLAIELGGKDPGEFDVLSVIGVANLAGTVDVSLVDGFVPTVGDMFTIITSTVGLGNQGGITLDSADVPFYQLMVNAGPMGTAMLKVIAAPGGGITGDFNGNGVVDAADYVLWRNGGTLQNDPTPGNDAGDYAVWRANFGKSGGGGAAVVAATVPEPASLALALLTIVGACVVFPQRRPPA